MDDLTELRAALIQLAKALDTQSACVKRIIHLVEKEQEKASAIIIHTQKREGAVLVESSRPNI